MMRCQSCHKEESMKHADICAICFGALQGHIQDMIPKNEWPDCLLKYVNSKNMLWILEAKTEQLL